jgi:hypothetical protein
VTVTLDATDVSGVAATYYTLDGVQHPYTTAFTVSAEGTHTLSYWSVDNSDNEEVPRKTASVWIDTAPPSTTCNVGGSYVGSATIGFAAGDGLGSGLDTIHWVLTGPEGKSGIGPVASVATAGTYTLQYWSVDKAGNEELPHKSAVFIVFPSPDTTAPHTVSNRVALYANSATIRLTSTDNPDGSGVAHTFYTLQGGSQIESSTVRVVAPGTYLMAFWSVDASGNIEPTQTVSFSVITSPSNKGTPSKPSVPSPVRHGRSFAASGYVIRHRSGTYPVVLQFYRYEHGHWRLRKSITARASNMLTFSKYSRSTTVPYAGKWRVRARHKVGTKYRYSSYRCFVAN